MNNSHSNQSPFSVQVVFPTLSELSTSVWDVWERVAASLVISRFVQSYWLAIHNRLSIIFAILYYDWLKQYVWLHHLFACNTIGSQLHHHYVIAATPCFIGSQWRSWKLPQMWSMKLNISFPNGELNNNNNNNNSCNNNNNNNNNKRIDQRINANNFIVE